MRKEIKIGIRELVEYVLRAGDLDNRFTGAARLLEATRAHQRLQKAAENYTPEVWLTATVEKGDVLLTLEGRADGIIETEDGITVDEIKTTTQDLSLLTEDKYPLHWAQAKCYACIYARERSLEHIGVQLTYFQLDTAEIRRFCREFTAEELEQFLKEVTERYFTWAEMAAAWSDTRDTTLRALEFPYETYRSGQRELAVSVYRTIVNEGRLFAQAPTGIGKTISTLFPSVKAMGEGKADKIFYLTAKTITRQVAEQAAELIRTKGARLRSVTLTAKEKICFCPDGSCTPEHCSYAKGHFDRVNDALMECVHNEENLNRECIERYAQRFHVCPFEFALDLTLWADCIICDYNYVFDPRVYLRRFFGEGGGEYIFLVDEAHNLVDRSREMFSAEVTKSGFYQVKKTVKDKALSKVLTKLNQWFLERRKQMQVQTETQEAPLDDLFRLVRSFSDKAERWLAENQSAPGFDQVLEQYFLALAYLRITEYYDEHYISLISNNAADLRVKLFCMDPSALLAEILTRARATVFFSATLTPLDYFRSILGGKEDDLAIRLPSPFSQENLCLMIADTVSTRYKNRSESCERVATLIARSIVHKKGNYIVYFPSYRYMEEVYTAFCVQNDTVETLVQSKGMTEEEREEFLRRFDSGNSETLVGFCVLGGMFSEGVDLSGDRLIGAVIVGVGLPQLNPELDCIMRYFNQQNGKGYEYSYLYPGMNKVLQAVGRVIRSETDRGLALLIDERFSDRNYRVLFPTHWSHGLKIKSPEQLDANVASFWNKN